MSNQTVNSNQAFNLIYNPVFQAFSRGEVIEIRGTLSSEWFVPTEEHVNILCFLDPGCARIKPQPKKFWITVDRDSQRAVNAFNSLAEAREWSRTSRYDFYECEGKLL